MYAITASSII